MPPEISDYDSDSPHRPHATSDSWRKSSRLSKAKELRKALAFQRQLEIASRDLNLISTAVSSDAISGSDHAAALERATAAVAASTAGLNQLFSGLAATSLFNERKTEDRAAKKVFDIPELLERILCFVDRMDVLQLQQVAKAMFSAIEGSALLQRKLHLRASLDGLLETPFANSRGHRFVRRSFKKRKHIDDRHYTEIDHPGFQCYYTSMLPRLPPDAKSPTEGPNRMISIIAKLPFHPYHASGISLLKIGTRRRAMLICQPPVLEMKIYPCCCYSNPYESGHPFDDPILFPPLIFQAPHPVRPVPEIITSKTGLTIGDLYDAAVVARERHRLCPFAGPYLHDERGVVQPDISFGGRIQLTPEDPVWAHLMPPLMPPIPDENADNEYERASELIQRYMDAKQQANANGLPIPTFEEFKLTLGAEP